MSVYLGFSSIFPPAVNAGSVESAEKIPLSFFTSSTEDTNSSSRSLNSSPIPSLEFQSLFHEVKGASKKRKRQESDQLTQQDRRERNRESAKRSRENRKNTKKHLEAIIPSLEKENQNLKNELDAITFQIFPEPIDWEFGEDLDTSNPLMELGELDTDFFSMVKKIAEEPAEISPYLAIEGATHLAEPMMKPIQFKPRARKMAPADDPDKERRLKSKREAAQRARERKHQAIEDLKNKVFMLEKENSQIRALIEENHRLL